MAIYWYINGNTLVSYNGSEFGFSDQEITVSEISHHTDVHSDDFGHDEPAEVLWMLAEFRIRMSLVYWDKTVQETAIKNGMGGASLGTFAGAGTIMRNFMKELRIASPNENKPYIFPKAYLTERPFELPLSNERSILVLNWRCLGLGSESPAAPASAGAILWQNS